ncbi:GNAT family N-acetyltransferase [Temperatibacter marinus]|uniref:GNAT family N-acetyltransferase n=1 Tax=Temperatibacter marinus TaxID=1456591 RepID=A0AA52EIA8_9PROT|nr:GNAT family N-acetyltransferase [Temperatibacter marinus]WND03057.1 GNAT family N-acetyltransferase [Temperatibacter marinus]
MAAHDTYSREAMSLKPLAIRTDRLILRKMLFERDMDAFVKMRMDPQVMQFIGMPPVKTLAECRTEAQKKNTNQDFKFFYSIFPKEEDQTMIGLVIMRPMPEGDTMEVGYWLMPPYWGKGYATEAASAVCQACAEAMDFPLIDISAHVMAGNGASRRVLEKVGLEVTRSSSMDVPNGKSVDVWWLNWKEETTR